MKKEKVNIDIISFGNDEAEFNKVGIMLLATKVRIFRHGWRAFTRH